MRHLLPVGDRWLPVSVFALLVVLSTVDAGAQTFGGQGLIFSARAGGRGVAVDSHGAIYALESAPAPDDASLPGIYVSKIDVGSRRRVYRAYLGHGDGLAIAVDGEGNAFVTGKAAKDDFRATQRYGTPGDGPAAFVVKLDASGGPAWATLVGGGESLGASIAVDAAGNTYVSGSTHTDDFPVTTGAFDQAFNGGGAQDPPSDAVVFKLDGSGGLVYSTYLGGAGYDEASGIAVDSAGNAYVAGWTYSSNFPITAGAFQAAGGSGDAFVVKLDALGSRLVYAARLGGYAEDYARAIAVDPSGRAVVVGDTLSANYPITPGAAKASYGGTGFDMFVTKLEAAGNALIYSTFLGGGDSDNARGVAVDRDGAAYLVGDTISYSYPVTTGAIQSRPQGSDDVVVTKLGPKGAIAYSTRLAGTGPDSADAIAVDAIGDVYLTGHGSTTFPISPDAPVTVPLSSVSPFVAKLVPRAARAVSATASSQESAVLEPGAAIDGNPATRWSSAFADQQWLLIDLGAVTAIDRFILTWEAAYGRDYQVQVSEDGTHWESMVERMFEDGGIDDFPNFGGYGRYVRVWGIRRGTQWGVSLWEVQVYGVPADVVNQHPQLALTSPPNAMEFLAPANLEIRAEASDPDGTITRVDFYINNTYHVTDNEAPYTALYVAQAGSYYIRATAVDDQGATASQVVNVTVVQPPEPAQNLAALRPAFASSVESATLAAGRAVDGAATTRWSSAFSDQQWIYVDLGQRVNVATVILRWEAAYAESFDLQVSDDAAVWTTIFSTTSGTGGIQLLQNLRATGSFVRMLGRKRATPWGYSLWEMEVYGTPAGPALVNIAAGKATVASSTESSALAAGMATDRSTTTRWASAFADSQWLSVDLGSIHDIQRVVLRWEAAYASRFLLQVSNDGTGWRTLREVFSAGGVDDLADLHGAARYVRMLAVARATPWGVSLWEFEVYGRPATMGANLARGATPTASSAESGALAAANAIDANAATRWSSTFADGQWIQLDFGAPVSLRRLVLRWETAYARQYVVQASPDGVTWRDALRVAEGDGGVDDLSVETWERYVRILCERRATEWGSSLWEIEAYGPEVPDPAVAHWQILVLIYDGTDITYTDQTGTRHVVGRVGPQQLAEAATAATRFVNEDIPALTSGHMIPRLTIRYPGTLTRLSAIGEGFWPSPWDVERDPAFDAVIVIWQANVVDQATGQALWIGTAAGLTPAMGTGQTYFAMIVDAANTYGHRNVFKHEWGHSITEYFEAAGTAPKPKVENHTEVGTYVHCGTGRGYVWQDETDANPIPNSIYHNTSGFTHDYYSGTTALATAPNACLGVTAAAWAAGGPVTKPSR